MSLADYIERKPEIVSAHLLLRPLRSSDIDALKEWMPDRSLYTFWGKGPSRSEKTPELLFSRPERAVQSFHLGIALKDKDWVIGDIWVYLIEKNRMASVALRINRNYQGRGYGAESLSAITEFCFRNTELRRLWAGIDVRNIASWKTFEKCGYKREGLIREGRLVNTWCDYYIYGMLADDLADTTCRLFTTDN